MVAAALAASLFTASTPSVATVETSKAMADKSAPSRKERWRPPLEESCPEPWRLPRHFHGFRPLCTRPRPPGGWRRVPLLRQRIGFTFSSMSNFWSTQQWNNNFGTTTTQVSARIDGAAAGETLTTASPGVHRPRHPSCDRQGRRCPGSARLRRPPPRCLGGGCRRALPAAPVRLERSRSPPPNGTQNRAVDGSSTKVMASSGQAVTHSPHSWHWSARTV